MKNDICPLKIQQLYIQRSDLKTWMRCWSKAANNLKVEIISMWYNILWPGSLEADHHGFYVHNRSLLGCDSSEVF